MKIYIPIDIEVGKTIFYKNKKQVIREIKNDAISLDSCWISFEELAKEINSNNLIMPQRYAVYVNGTPASNQSDKKWMRFEYDTFQEALEYARKYMGEGFNGSVDGKTGFDLELNKAKSIKGYKIEIRSI